MARPFSAPDPKDRSVNEPSQIVSAAQVLGLYNQENRDSKKEKVVESVKDWYEQRMLQAGWEKVDFHGSQCVVTAHVSIVPRRR